MNILFKFFFIIIIKSHFISKADSKKKTSGKIITSRRNNEDRFIRDLDDEDWHVAHLRDVELDGRRDCKGDTFKEKASRYRKSLRNDGALVQFVSADPLPFNQADLHKDACQVEDMYEKAVNMPFISPTAANTTNTNESRAAQIEPSAVTDVLTHATSPTPVVKTITSTPPSTNQNVGTTPILTKDPISPDAKIVHSVSSSDIKNLNRLTSPLAKTETTPIRDYKATILDIKPEDSEEEDKGDKKTKDKIRRASEYMFSSVEYYDEIPDFDPSVCPDAVDVIELQIDQLRRYNIECERMIMWVSLID